MEELKNVFTYKNNNYSWNSILGLYNQWIIKNIKYDLKEVRG